MSSDLFKNVTYQQTITLQIIHRLLHIEANDGRPAKTPKRTMTGFEILHPENRTLITSLPVVGVHHTLTVSYT